MWPSLRVWALLLVSAGAGCGSGAQAAPPKATPAPRVATVAARAGTIQPTLRIAGVIAPYRQLGIASALAEPLAEVDVREGQRVRAGDVLARLQTDDLEAQLASAQRVVAEDVARVSQTSYQAQGSGAQDLGAVRAAQASLRQAQTDLSGARADFARYQRLASAGYLPQQTLDQQRTTVANDVAALSAAQAALASAQANAAANGSGYGAGAQQAQIQAARAAADAAAASAEQLRRQIARATIVAPIDGVVVAVNANPGEYPSGRQLFTLEQNDRVYAVLSAASNQVPTIREGAAATISPNGVPGSAHGTVEAVLDQIQPGTTNFTVKVLIDNAARRLHAGVPVTGTVDLPAVRGTIVPVTAFVDDDRSSVYAVHEGRVRIVHVSEKSDDGNEAVVSGLAPGTPVVKNVQQSDVGNGDKVRT